MSKTLKKYLITIFAGLPVETVNDITAVLVTPIGLIRGKAYRKDKPSPDISTVATICESLEEDYLALNEIAGNDGYVMLYDGTITTAGSTVHFEELAVFFDQVIGVTLEQS